MPAKIGDDCHLCIGFDCLDFSPDILLCRLSHMKWLEVFQILVVPLVWLTIFPQHPAHSHSKLEEELKVYYARGCHSI